MNNDYEETEELLRQFFDGSIGQEGLARLYKTFLNHPEAATRWPDEARMLVPMGYAYFAHKGKASVIQTPRANAVPTTVGRPKTTRTLRYAAVAALVIGASVAAYYYGSRQFHFTSNADLTEAEVLEWFDNTIKSAS